MRTSSTSLRVSPLRAGAKGAPTITTLWFVRHTPASRGEGYAIEGGEILVKPHPCEQGRRALVRETS